MTVGSVLLVANYPSDVGYAWWLMESYWVRIAERVAAAGRQCLLAYPEVRRLPPTIAAAPLSVAELSLPDRPGSTLRRFLEFLRSHDVTGLYLTDRRLADWRYPLFRLAGVQRIVVHDHTPGDRPPIGGAKGAAKAVAHRLPWWCCDRAIGVTEFVRQRQIHNARFPAGRCRVVPNGIPGSPVPTAEEREAARRLLQLDPGSVAVGLVSRAHRVKNWSFAIQTAARVAAVAPKLIWVFCGDGPDLAGFQREAERAGVAGRCRFLGRCADVTPLLAGLDIGMHPSHGEVGYSLAILEFMRAGLPTVVPDLPSVRGATRQDETGLVYRAGDLDDAVAAILRLARDAELRQRLGRAARADAERRFGLEETLRVLEREVAEFL